MIGRRGASRGLLAAVLAVASLLAPAPPPAAGSDGPCPGTSGVTVIVDYQALGGGVVVRCAPGSPASGFKALTSAGFDIVQVQNVPGFLCRVDGRPTVEQDACINTPPANAYWSYWHAARGGAWATSLEGGATRTPPAGSVDGWSFSDDGSPGAASPPGIDPPPKPATPKPATAKPATPKPATPKPEPKARPTINPGAPATMAPTPTTAPRTVDPSASASASSSASSATTASDPGESPPAASADPSTIAGGAGSTSGGSPPPSTLVGAGLVLLIAGAALLARARRPTGVGGDA